MTLFPIVERELRVAARRRGTYWLRSGVALAVLAIAMWVYFMARSGPPSTLSMAMFSVLTGASGIFCLTAGARATADSLSEEKRDGTLGLLFLTDLRGYDVVAGKLVAGSLNAFYGLVATLPILAIPLLMGGVTPAEFGRMALVLLNTLFFSLAAGIFASSLTKSARNSAGLCMFIVLGLTGGLPLIGWLLSIKQNYHVEQFFLIPSPGFAFAVAFDALHKGASDEFWTSLLFVHVLSWVLLGIACLVVPRSWQDRAATVTEVRWRDRWLRWTLGDSEERRGFRERMLNVNPFFWLASRSRLKPVLVWGLLGALTAGWLWGWQKFGRDWINPGTYIVTALLLNTVMKSWVAGETCAQLAEDRRIGALELLLSTPLTVTEVMRGQFLALIRQFLWPVVFVVCVEMVFMIAGLNSNDVSRGRDGTIWVLVWMSGLIMLVADLAALYYVGLWQSLTARNANRANTAAVVRILALPWILFGGFMMFGAIVSFSGPGPGIEPEAFVLFWLFIGLGVDAFFGVRARMNLEQQFREVATARYTQPPSAWQRLFGTGSGTK